MSEPRGLKIVAGALIVAKRAYAARIETDDYLKFATQTCVASGIDDTSMQLQIASLGFEFLRDFMFNFDELAKMAEHFEFMIDPTTPEGEPN